MLRTTWRRGGTTATIAALAVALMLLALTPVRTALAADAPTVTSVTPATGLAAGGSTIAITGTGFSAGAVVTIGGTAATGVVFNSATSLSAVTPVGVPGPTTITVTNLDGQSGTLSNGFNYLDLAPVVTSVSPPSGPTTGGTTITIVGTSFRSGATVSVGNTAATAVVVVNATTITAVTPARAVGLVGVRVTNSDTQSGLLADSFTYIAAPAPLVTTVVPATGPTVGGTAVTISGTGFVAGATVTFDGVAATAVNVTNSTTITATTPAHATGAVAVAVRNPDSQSGTLASGFVYSAAPTVTSVNPANGPTVGGTDVTINGTGFVTGATVAFGGVAATNVNVVSSTKITLKTPPRTNPDVVQVVVTNPGGLAGNLGNAFTYTAVVSISSVAPAKGPTGGGTAVIIAGTGFVNGTSVTFGGIVSPTIVVISPAQLIATTPARSGGTVDVVVTLPGGAKATRTNAFTFEGLSISSVTPATGTTAGGTTVKLLGSGFAKGALVFFDNALATDFQFISQGEVQVKTPAHAAGRVTVLVINPGGGTALLTEGYRYILSAPTIQRIAPSTGPTTGGVSVSIEGSGFDSGATVDFGGAASANVNIVSSTLIVAVTPLHVPGVVVVTVRNRDGSEVKLAGGYIYEGAAGVLAGPLARNGLSLVVFSGGTTDQLIAAASLSCTPSRLGIFTTVGGRWVILLPGAPPNVNAEWNSNFPAGLPKIPLLFRCA
ncbi:MAG: IPT/TIG domain-containing protein [Chloroflexi bacterium]|nr:IPT/TIG domain-containing protein [Chloroflexota bacterium]MDA1145332.1 IPT/TIG domain-containing protein [Chloroflexota bacterium]